MANFLLVHGMFHGGWSWSKLAMALEGAGHRVWAPDLAGCGESAVPAAEATLAGWVDDLSALIATIDGPIVLVGHSRGGLVISQVAEAVPDRIAALVYVAALLLPGGKSAMNLPEIAGDGAEDDVSLIRPQLNPAGDALLLGDDAAAALYAESPAEERDWAMARIGPEPLAPLLQPLSLTLDRYGRVPKVYVQTTRDRAIPFALQRAMIALSPPDGVFTLDADHMPNVHNVPELAEILNGVADQAAFGLRSPRPA